MENKGIAIILDKNMPPENYEGFVPISIEELKNRYSDISSIDPRCIDVNGFVWVNKEFLSKMNYLEPKSINNVYDTTEINKKIKAR